MNDYEYMVRWHEGQQVNSKRFSRPDSAQRFVAAVASEPWAQRVEIRAREVSPWQPVAVSLAVSS